MKKVYFIGIGGIGISAVARYYNENGWQVFGSDKYGSELVETLKKEGMDIIIGEDEKRITSEFDLVIYTEAIPNIQEEIIKSRGLGIKTISYPESLASIANEKKLIAISGSHGKSTTTSMISIMLKNTDLNFTSIIGTLLKEFGNKNFYNRHSELVSESIIQDITTKQSIKDPEINSGGHSFNYFVIEACEYKRAFINYTPFIGIITNIDLDHLDYYNDLEDYESAFKTFLDNIKSGGYALLNANCTSSMKLFNLRNDINYIIINNDNYLIAHIDGKKETINFPKISLQIPGKHIEFDAKIAFAVGKILNLEDKDIINSLENYTGVWRRSEIIGTTDNGNILMSDYGHHPTEITLTLDALKQKNIDKKLFVVFQPHQYNRTLNLIEGFKDCFSSADTLIIPDIYESRDSFEDKEKINSEKLIELINHPNKFDGNGFENTLKSILDYDTKNPNSSIILLLGAGNVDDLRYKIKVI
ncbi:MAG: Mur ligase family protein [Candidatus Gracilibacteria bacterium]